MRVHKSNPECGFSLVELLIVMVVGGIVLGAATMAFKNGTDASNRAAGREEALENARGALNLIAKDVSMAGAGLPPGGLALPYGSGTSASMIGCPQTGSCYMSGNDYPSGTVSGATVNNYMYGLIPAPGRGIEVGSSSSTIPATGAIPDGITVVYEDFACQVTPGYTATFPDNTGTSLSAVTVPAGCATILGPEGFQVGDLLLLTSTSAAAVGEVTGIAGGGSTIDFADDDPLKINQSGAPSGNIASIYTAAANGVSLARIWTVSYFIDVQSGQPPRLMRQVSGQTAVPVADNIIGMNFTYDVCDSTVPLPAGCNAVSDPITAGYSPNNIYKVNIELMAQSTGFTSSQSTALTTSVMTRNMSYKQRY